MISPVIFLDRASASHVLLEHFAFSPILQCRSVEVQVEVSKCRSPLRKQFAPVRRKEHVVCAEPDGRQPTAQVAPGLLFPPLLKARRIRFGRALAQRTRQLFQALGQGMNCRVGGREREKIQRSRAKGLAGARVAGSAKAVKIVYTYV
jgi:hypothetical protein